MANNGELLFLMKFIDVPIAEEFPAYIANFLWPKSVIRFYESRLKWYTSQQQNAVSVDQATTKENNEGTEGVPQNIQCKLFH